MVRYFDEVRAVISAGQRLDFALADDPPVRRAAARKLELALAREDAGHDVLNALMFAAGRQRVVGAPSLASEDAFGSVLLQVQVANVSLSAGAAVGEAGMEQRTYMYQEALEELRLTANRLQDVVAPRKGGVPLDGELGFRFRPRDDASGIDSATLAGARAALSARVDRTVGTIVDESHTVATAVWQEASALPGATVLNDVIGLAGDLRFPAEQIGRLLALGLRKLHAAIGALKRLFALADVEETEQHLRRIWSNLTKQDDLLALHRVYGTEHAMAAKEKAVTVDLPMVRFDEASRMLDLLAERFRASMLLARRLLRALVVASEFVGALVLLIPGVNLHHLALTATGLLLLLTGVVLSGMDYADSGAVLGRVHGVRSVLQELAA